jgi:hypothetical protein
MNPSDAKDAIRAFDKEPTCGLLLNGGACMYRPACRHECKFLIEAGQPQKTEPQEHEGSQTEAEERRAYEYDLDEYQNHPERFR